MLCACGQKVQIACLKKVLTDWNIIQLLGGVAIFIGGRQVVSRRHGGRGRTCRGGGGDVDGGRGGRGARRTRRGRVGWGEGRGLFSVTVRGGDSGVVERAVHRYNTTLVLF
jgi:hypothetical protein